MFTFKLEMVAQCSPRPQNMVKNYATGNYGFVLVM